MIIYKNEKPDMPQFIEDLKELGYTVSETKTLIKIWWMYPNFELRFVKERVSCFPAHTLSTTDGSPVIVTKAADEWGKGEIFFFRDGKFSSLSDQRVYYYQFSSQI